MAEAAEMAHTRSEDEIAQTIKGVAHGWSRPRRSPVLKTPAVQGLEFEEVTFPSQDGVPLEAWYIPCLGSKRLVIANHPLSFNRYGYPSHLEPWRSFGALGGNTFEVDYLADYRILHQAGYNVLTYDERNFGLSGASNGGLNSGGRFEARDVVGSLLYVQGRADCKDMAIGLFSRCNGANATLYAFHTQPRHFDQVRCLLLCQPLSIRSVLTRELEMLGMPGRVDQLEREIQIEASCSLDEMSPNIWAQSIHLPTFIYQVHDDLMTTPADVQATFDAMPVKDKQLHWIHGTTARWDGYLEFQRRPEPMLDWLAKHMS